MLIIRFHKSAFFLLLLIFLSRSAYCDEIYYIDNPLFLYKTINWWYDCLPKEFKILWGRPIKCSNIGNALVEYDEINKTLEINIKGG